MPGDMVKTQKADERIDWFNRDITALLIVQWYVPAFVAFAGFCV
jgi:hypothetical protein